MVDTVTINSTDSGLSLEDEAAAQEAAAKVAEPKLAGEETTPERPEWLPEKFATVEDMAKAYAELEKAQGKPKEAAKTEAEQTAEAAVESAGLDMDALSTEWETNGELSEASYEKLAKAGITKDMVDSYIAGQEAQANQIREQLLEPVGGEEAYADMITWAGENLTDGEIDAYNRALDSGDMGTIQMAVENLRTKFTNANGFEPVRTLNGRVGDGGTSVYESTADLMKDMQNPEYAKNPSFRAKVEAKLARSNIL